MDVGTSYSLPPDYSANVTADEDQALQDFVGEMARRQLGPEASEAEVNTLKGELSKTMLPQLRQKYYQIHKQAVHDAGEGAKPVQVQKREDELFTKLKTQVSNTITKAGVTDLESAIQTFTTKHLTSLGGSGEEETKNTNANQPKLVAAGAEGTQAETVATQWFANIIDTENLAPGVLDGLMGNIPTQWQDEISEIVGGDLSCLDALDPKTADNLMVIGGYVKLIAQVLSIAKKLLANIQGLEGEGGFAAKIDEAMTRLSNMEELYDKIDGELQKQLDAAKDEGGIFGHIQGALLGTGIAGLTIGGIIAPLMGVFAPIGMILSGPMTVLANVLGLAGPIVGMVVMIAIHVMTLGTLTPLILIAGLVTAPLFLAILVGGVVITTLAPILAMVMGILMVIDGAQGGIFTPSKDDIDATKDKLKKEAEDAYEAAKLALQQGGKDVEELGEEEIEKIAEQVAVILAVITSLVMMLTAAIESAGASLPKGEKGTDDYIPQGEFDAAAFVSEAKLMMTSRLTGKAIHEMATQMGLEEGDASKLEDGITGAIQLSSLETIGKRRRRSGSGDKAITYDHYDQSANAESAGNLVLNSLGLAPKTEKVGSAFGLGSYLITENDNLLKYLSTNLAPQMTEFVDEIMKGINQRLEDNTEKTESDDEGLNNQFQIFGA